MNTNRLVFIPLLSVLLLSLAACIGGATLSVTILYAGADQ